MCDCMVVTCFAGLGGFVACRSLSQRNNDPTKASRPWDVVCSFALTCYSFIKVTDDCILRYWTACLYLAFCLRVNSTKSMTGHLLGAAGAVEAVAVVQVMISSFLYLAGFLFWAIRTRWIHPNINLDNPEKSVDVNLLVGSKKERLDVKVAVSNSFGFGGHNSSILLAPYKQ
ncbi:hypothetical protein BHE74_00031588 [Ensete ventricosum]|nr:hypothetical protein BHE74_00031588 [Ensete ventricosum]